MKTNPIKAIIFAFLLAATGSAAIAQQQTTPPETHSFSAKEAVDYALKNAIQVKNALLDIKAQEQTNKEITASALPQPRPLRLNDPRRSPGPQESGATVSRPGHRSCLDCRPCPLSEWR